MIFLVALVLSVVLCVQTALMEIVKGNTIHVRHGREPNAGVSLFPMVPLYQLIALGLAWGLQHLMADMAIAVLLAIFAGLCALWVVSYRHAQAEYRRVRAISREQAPSSISSP